jgi:uncharacterized RDD family membrane protein YckC
MRSAIARLVKVRRDVTDSTPPADGDEDDAGLTGILGRAGHAALRPVRRVAQSGRDALADEAERAIDGVMAGPLPEAVGRSMVENRVIKRAVASALEARKAQDAAGAPSIDLAPVEEFVRRTLADPAVEGMLKETISSRLTAELADEIVQSPAFKRTLKIVLESPEMRHALERQTAGFGSDIARAARRKAHGADNSLESSLWGLLRRHPDPARDAYGGFVTRALGLLTDLLCTQLIYLVLGGMIGLVTSIFGALKPTWLVGTLAAIGLFLVVGVYFVVSWTTVGQTPGMRVMRLRVLHDGQPPGVWRSFVRLVVLVLCIIPCFAGFIPVLFDRRRRGLHDYAAGTSVVYDSDPVEVEVEPA